MTTHRFDVYAAGLVDGEGCITAKSAKSGTGMGIRVLVGMATKAQEILVRMQSTYGGTLITQEPSNKSHAPITTWTVNGRQAAAFLRRIEPHLILKSEHAKVALQIEELRTSQPRIGSRDHYRWSPEATAQAKEYADQLTRLNARGRDGSTTSTVPFARLVDGTWVTNQADLFSEAGWEPFTATWPRSGSMSGGRAFEHPTSVPRTTGNDCSSSPHLPTPRSSRGASATETMYAFGAVRDDSNRPQGEVVLPTPKACDGIMGRPRTSGRPIEKSTHLGTITTLLPNAQAPCLPTPTASDGEKERNNPSQARRKSPPLSAISAHFPETDEPTIF